MRVLVTGASGLIGQALCTNLARIERFNVVGSVRLERHCCPSDVPLVVVGELTNQTEWALALRGVQVVVHAAARVHMMEERASDPLAEFRRVNVEGTLNLARQAAAFGVRRFVFISSVKVNGDSTNFRKPYSADDTPAPVDPYGVSKMEAESGLLKLAKETGMEVVIIRPVLVYGPGVKANFLNMMKWLRRGVPLPFGLINNKRSLVALENLVNLILTCLDHPAAANQIFMVSDGEDLSTAVLLRQMGVALGKPARLLPVPVFLLKVVALLLGKRNLVQRLCGSLQVDISKTRDLLNWKPLITVQEGLKKTAEGFK